MSRGRRTPLLLVGLLLVLALHLAFFVSRQSQTWDEGNHLYAGYRSLTHADFGLNPEHPPLAKMLAAAPLLGMHLRVPPLQDRDFKREAFLGGRSFVFGNDADALLFRARMSAGLLTLLLALLAFLAAREMFGTAAGFTALALLAFDPNLIAHGALVTTDAGFSCFLLASVYAFYRSVRAPSWPRIALVGLAAGLALATKHTGILVFPILALLALAEWLRGRGNVEEVPFRTRGLRLAGALALVGTLAVLMLWAAYGFRYAARPDGLALNPPAEQILTQVPKPSQAVLLTTLARWRLLPESYLCGLADILVMEAYYRSYLFGKVYLHGVWFYFPAAYLVKSTLAFLVLPAVILAAIARRLAAGREILFLTVPPLFYLLVAMSSRMNIGVRHILPLYPFIAILGAGALWAFAAKDRRWGYPCRQLPTLDGFWLLEVPQVPAQIEGTVVISAGVLSGFEAGPGALHLYGAFEKIPPTAQIDGGLLVYDGRFQIPLASSLARAEKAEAELAAGRPELALEDARQAVALAPTAVKPNVILGDALAALGRPDEARPVYEAALHAARTIEPEFQASWIDLLESKLRSR